ncbi:MAG: hypothetical protein NC548_27520 [Lachnospiraceae bacterium]|nr:hypothetical protein [Lachnospiraceae bacterium]
MEKNPPYFVYNENKKLVYKISHSHDLLYFAKKFGYAEHISALVDKSITDEIYQTCYKDTYDKIMNIDMFRISKGDEYRQKKRTHMEFARTLVSNFIIEDIFIKLFNDIGGVQCRINEEDKDRDIIPSGKVKHTSDLMFCINNTHKINVELKNIYHDSKSFSLSQNQLEGYKNSGGVVLILKPTVDKYAIINVNKTNLILSKFDEKSVYCYPSYQNFSFTKECFTKITKEILTLSSN